MTLVEIIPKEDEGASQAFIWGMGMPGSGKLCLTASQWTCRADIIEDTLA
jgi:hypothetical protein